MALITINAVVHISVHLGMTEIVGVVASMASRALKNRVVVRVDVARRANIIGTAMAGGELRVLRVIEGRVRPARCVMAILARSREKQRLRRVARIGSVVVVGLVASDARRGQRCVVAIDVAIAALPGRHGVQTREGEGGVVVIKDGICPDSGVMADLASRRETRRLVWRIICACPVFLMTRVTQRAVQRVVIVGVAIGADPRWHGVLPRQGEARTAVVERAIGPMHGVVAGLACRRESRHNVIHGRHRSGVVLLMTRIARCTRQVVVVVDVAVHTLARRHHVRAGQRKAGAVVVEIRA